MSYASSKFDVDAVAEESDVARDANALHLPIHKRTPKIDPDDVNAKRDVNPRRANPRSRLRPPVKCGDRLECTNVENLTFQMLNGRAGCRSLVRGRERHLD